LQQHLGRQRGNQVAVRAEGSGSHSRRAFEIGHDGPADSVDHSDMTVITGRENLIYAIAGFLFSASVIAGAKRYLG